ncbi:MAG: lipid-A-disaccharide synthase [Candidatus Omnitrophica bacterium]|nr:lipid-A-disaccharide synthase [Candidatus Omnitrophota bacterium]
MDQSQKLLMIIAGEVSGDMRAAEVARAIKELSPSVRMTGVGGQCMKDAGVQCFANITELAVIGFVEVIKNYGRIKKVFDQILSQVDRNRPDAVMLVDYPGFNLRLARKLKERRIKVIYYVSPQVWAWKENRIHTIKQVVDKMIVLFSFEKEFYQKRNITVDYVGHPLVDQINVTEKPEIVLTKLGLKPHQPVVGLLPGSREKEITRHLPVMLQASQLLYNKNPKRQFVILKSPTIDERLIKDAVAAVSCPITIIEQHSYNELNTVSACMVASGTATLEAAILKKPMVIIYKTSWLTYLLAKAFVKISHIGLANIVAGKTVVPELIQDKANAVNIAAEMEKLLTENLLISKIQKEFSRYSTWLGLPGSCHRTAKIILKELS